MVTQLKSIVGFREEDAAEVDAPAASAVGEGSAVPDNASEVMKTRIEDLELSSRTISALEKANIRTVGGLARQKGG